MGRPNYFFYLKIKPKIFELSNLNLHVFELVWAHEWQSWKVSLIQATLQSCFRKQSRDPGVMLHNVVHARPCTTSVINLTSKLVLNLVFFCVCNNCVKR